MSQRVVITGLGAITPVGHSVDQIWQALGRGESGIGHITRFDAGELSTNIAGEVKDFDPEALFGKREARRLDRCSQFALEAGRQAIEDAGLLSAEIDRSRVGVVIGTGIGGASTFIEQADVVATRGPRRVSPFFIPMILPDSPGAQLAITYGFRGPSLAVSSACATGTNAVGEAFEMIARGAADIIVAGGTEAPLTLPIMAGFSVMKALSTRNDNPKTACRPFDATRDGFVASEGAAVLILESLEHARARQANIYAEVIGYGTSVDASHMVAPEPEGTGASQAINAALQRAQLAPTAIDYVNAHGTSTHLNDATETRALKRSLGDQAYKVAISSTKSMTGHLLGGAGALESLVCVKTIQTGVIPPTINYEHPDPECDLDYTPNQPRQAHVQVAMSNSFGFGGHNATIVVKQHRP